VEYTKRLKKPETLADADSRFIRLLDTDVRWKESRPEISSSANEDNRRCLILVHGFGASLFTFQKIMGKLATTTQSIVRAFDLPAFGLTQRSKNRRLYSIRAMSEITDQFAGLSQTPGRGNVILGHSMGALVALTATTRFQRHVSALILVSPAISFQQKRLPKRHSIKHRLRAMLLPLRYALATAQVTLRLVTAQTARVFFPVFQGLLRLVVGQKRLWEYGLKMAVEDPSTITEDTLIGYRLPDRVMDWDRALLTFIINRFQAAFSLKEFFDEIRQIVHGRAIEDYSEMLERLKKSNIPVLIIHGADDRIVPVSNSEQLAEFLGCELSVFERCGHIPQEEMPDQFADCIASFLTQTDSRSRSLQPVGFSAF
jgi:pimeloyl-ACP methyl ester carboxylesterase